MNYTMKNVINIPRQCSGKLFEGDLSMTDNIGNYARHAAIWDWGGYDRLCINGERNI